jgi:hypothetical protein
MNKLYLAISTALIIIVVLLSGLLLTNQSPSKSEKPNAYVGIAYCGDTVEQGKQLIDKVKGYANLFSLQSGLLQRDLDSVEELGDYAIESGMYFLPYFGYFVPETFSVWLESAKAKWGDHLLGIYHGDEPGGKMLDGYVEYKDNTTGDSIVKSMYGDVVLQKANNIIINYEFDGDIRLSEPALGGSTSDLNSEAVFHPNGTVEIVRLAPNGFSYQTYQQLEHLRPLKDNHETAQRFYSRDKDSLDLLRNFTKVFTSDYGMYWFDYKAGYDVILSQLGWNISVNQQISFLRGAATAQQKDWGVIITWKYQTPPYLDSGTEIFNQLKTSYECGAKYFVIFNYYGENAGTYGTMQEEHFEALKSFWRDVVNNPQIIQGSIKADSVIVFPKDYGWGARWAEDKIWGIFKADNQTKQMWTLVQKTLETHGLKTDISYEDTDFPLSSEYQNIYYWNES